MNQLENQGPSYPFGKYAWFEYKDCSDYNISLESLQKENLVMDVHVCGGSTFNKGKKIIMKRIEFEHYFKYIYNKDEMRYTYTAPNTETTCEMYRDQYTTYLEEELTFTIEKINFEISIPLGNIINKCTCNRELDLDVYQIKVFFSEIDIPEGEIFIKEYDVIKPLVW